MAIERTLTIIKPDGVERNLIGEILKRYEDAGLTILAIRMLNMSRASAEDFYGEHEGKVFYERLVEYMSTGPIVVACLEGEGAIATLRKVAGATDPAQADKGTIRGDFGLGLPPNTVHGSDSVKSAEREIAWFFRTKEISPRPVKG